MSRTSHKTLMRDALQITEGNLTRMIGSRFTPATVSSGHFIDLMTAWRDMCRRALDHITETPECICAKCGLRHGGSSKTDGGF